uniref:Bm13055, isoform b n=1 Tax=Brugia malayi TaxID=6279 RepID=A0A1I9G131_BRUMA|nr:Bm13055, isoform b [Brugia malayi]
MKIAAYEIMTITVGTISNVNTFFFTEVSEFFSTLALTQNYDVGITYRNFRGKWSV